MTSTDLTCCCGKETCSSRQRNSKFVNELEQDLYDAGVIGQDLLRQHERLVADSQAEKEQLSTAMDALESERSKLETANAKIIGENRLLLTQLEELNSAVVDSDSHIESLNRTLDSTRHELNRLLALAGKASQLENELSGLETERAGLEAQLVSHDEERRFAQQRWKRAEATILRLQDDITRLNDQAQEVHDVPSKPQLAPGKQSESRPFDHLSIGSMSREAAGLVGPPKEVVSSFVKEILQDNTNLQFGVAELRNMLTTSNSEIRNLRALLEVKTGSAQDADLESQSLHAEITTTANDENRLETVPELHVHHHYHQQRQSSRRMRRKRPALTLGGLHRSNLAHTSLPEMESHSTDSAQIAKFEIESDAGGALKRSHWPKWSVNSTATESSRTASSVSTSPPVPSVFDSFDLTYNQTRSTTPSSSVPGSPIHHPRALEFPASTITGIKHRSLKSKDSNFQEIHHQNEFVPGPNRIATSLLSSVMDEDQFQWETPRPEACLISISGMDIPTRAYATAPPIAKERTLSQAGATAFKEHVIPQLTTANATGDFSHQTTDVKALRSRFVLQHSAGSKPSERDISHLTRMTDWVLKRKVSPSVKVASEIAIDQITTEPVSVDEGEAFRSPGINQPGLIFGLRRPLVAPTNVQPREVDAQLLRDALQDD